MIRSMTGYGRSQQTVDGMNITLEVKSVNHRYFEFSTRLPRSYSFLEEKLKTFFSGTISRGKVECSVSIETLEEPDTVITLNHPLLKSYLQAYKELTDDYAIPNDISVSSLSRVPDLFIVRKQEADEEKIWAAVSAVAAAALENFTAMREREGAKLKDDVSQRLDIILDRVSFIEERSPETVREYNEKLVARLKELLGDTSIDEQRILTEAAIFADKIAVAEETVRLRSHVSQLRSFLDSDGPIGKKMDFLVQELNREANTTGSKCQDVEIARRVVDIKAEIEKIREQIQNIE
ncbi:MAG: YicC family protein [Clostridia bacterium]|nr:YicC family protein [Clostridia bacterium]MBQ4245209.1 YicC family protein [Clostridia bacterium]